VTLRTMIPAPQEGPMHDRILYRLTWLPLALSLGHHLDHLVPGRPGVG
jgi:hypothetical protein